ncbi:MAG: hypothetical protein KY456_07535 [Chloroflexi bacterium]|nr:hypothetical protein [Chloroflexota bacterium]
MLAAHNVHHDSNRQRAHRHLGITPRIARRGIDSSKPLERHRWAIECTFAWLLGCLRLGLQNERQANLLRRPR